MRKVKIIKRNSLNVETAAPVIEKARPFSVSDIRRDWIREAERSKAERSARDHAAFFGQWPESLQV